MARRRTDIEVALTGTADFGRARRDAKRDFDRIEQDGQRAAEDLKRAFDRVELSPELDTIDIRQAIDLADQLDGMVAQFTVDTDLEEIQQAEKIARSLRAFQGRVDLSVEGRDDLKDALDLASKMDQIREVKVQVQGQQDLRRAADLADDLERSRTVRLDVNDSDIGGISSRLTSEGEAGAEGIADAIESIDFDNIGSAAFEQMSSALSAAGPWGAAAGAAAAVFGDEFISGVSQGFNQRRNEVIRSITTGASEADLATAGRAAGAAWSAGFGESLPQLQADADELVRILGDMADEADFEPMLKQAQLLSDILGVEVAEAAQLARRSVNQGLADDWEDAFDDMIGVTQEFGDAGVEALDLLEEFGPNFARFGIDGGRAAQFVASAFQDGLFPTIDRAGELFEEFTTRVVDADAADAIAELGLNFRQIQDDVAAGGQAADDAMTAVVERLLAVDDAADRARLGNIIFGQSVEQVTDQAELYRRVLVLLGDETDAYAGKASEVTAALEAQASGWQQIGRDVSDASVFIGEGLRDATDFMFGFREELGLGSGGLLDWIGLTGDAADGTDDLSDAADNAARSTGSFSTEADYAAEAVGGVEDAVEDLRSELNQLFDFEADQLMRDIAEAGDRLADSFDGGAASALGFNGEIDITTAEGRELQSRLETLTEALIDLQVAYSEGELTAAEFRQGQALVDSEFDRVANAAGLTRDQVEALRRKYIEVKDIGTITTKIEADTSFAYNEMERFKRLADSIPRNITTTATTRTRTSSSGSSSGSLFGSYGYRRLAGGGVAYEPELALIGDNLGAKTDPEIVTPQSLMEDTLVAALRRAGFGTAGQTPAVAIENLNVADGRPIWRELDELQALTAASV